MNPDIHSKLTSPLASPLTLGELKLRNRLALAPMAGLTDVPFRTQAWRMGAGYMVSEMVGSKPQLWDTGKSRLRRVSVAGVDINAVQIAGTDPQVMADAARSHADAGAQVIDLNFGCPAKKVCRKAAGSALLADTDLIARIVSAVVASVDVPVTVKTRLGLQPGDGLGRQAVVAAEQAGAQMAVLHARTRACRFVGLVNYAEVRAIKQSVSIPILINGDIDNEQALLSALSQSNADGVMIGRAAVGQPWLFDQLLGRPIPDQQQQWQVMLNQTNHAHEFYGEYSGVRIIRKHIQAFLNRMGLSDQLSGFMQQQSAGGQLDYLHRLAERGMRAA